MAFSFSRLVLTETSIETYRDAVTLLYLYDLIGKSHGYASYTGEISGQTVWLGFSKIGRPSWKCSCASENLCVHIIAIALAWDRLRNVSDPSTEDQIFLCRNKSGLEQ